MAVSVEREFDILNRLGLHARAQMDLMRFVRERLLPAYQVVYTTHSPFMIDAEHLDGLRTVEDSSDGETVLGTKVGDRLPMMNREFVVAGIARAGAGGRLYARIEDVQEAVGSPDKASFFLVKGRSSRDAEGLLHERPLASPVTSSEEIAPFDAPACPGCGSNGPPWGFVTQPPASTTIRAPAARSQAARLRSQ